ncbi:G-protein gamma subunit [Syncephalastrum racemosum]|uniref:Guanine nucleotide-binding protein subunit gamma n=1 Tax=Syncephalastrum racemosum TaxID=13706 RepID=A0A1X2HRV2_SYNRA|nr:G-protein gamma subunit [Syncephalastrum racemosum]
MNHRNIAEAKLNRLLDYNRQLKDQLNIQRVTVSAASDSLFEFCQSTKDPMVPSVWGPMEKHEDPFAAKNKNCSLM